MGEVGVGCSMGVSGGDMKVMLSGTSGLSAW